MSVLLSNWPIQELESWRWVFNFLLIVSTLAVAIGVFFEREGNPDDVKKYGWKLVLRGVAFEFLFAVLLWQLDSTITTRQKAEITRLEVQIQPRRISLVQCREIAKTATPFVGRTVRVQTYAGDAEGSTLGAQIAVCLAYPKTLRVEIALASIMPLGGFGSGVFVAGTAKNKDLVAALKEALGRKAKLVISPGTGWFSGNIESGRPSVAPDANIIVGVKPVPDIKMK